MNFNAKAPRAHARGCARRSRSAPCRNGPRHLYRDTICTCCGKRTAGSSPSPAPLRLLDRRLRSLRAALAEAARLIFIIHHQTPAAFHRGKKITTPPSVDQANGNTFSPAFLSSFLFLSDNRMHSQRNDGILISLSLSLSLDFCFHVSASPIIRVEHRRRIIAGA